jgi:predicted permease
MSAFASALIPILAIIVLGYLLRRFEVLPQQARRGMERLTFFVLFPALLIRTHRLVTP